MKKTILVLLVLLMMVAVLFAGGNTESSSSDGTVKVTVMCSYAAEDPHGKYVYEYADKFMELNPNVTIEIQAVASNDIYTKLAAMATSPRDLPTMFFTSADAVSNLYDLGLTEDLNNWLTEEDRAKWAAGILESGVIDGVQTYIPVSVQPTGVIYRIDRFEEAGLTIPESWDEFVECAKILTKDSDGDGKIDQWGFGMVGSNDSSGQSRFMCYLWSNGYDIIYSEDGEWKTDIVDDAEFIKVFSKWTDMNVAGIVPVGITSVNYSTAANYFAMGYTSMFLTGPNALGVAYANNPDLRGKLGSFKIPGDYAGTMNGAEGYAVSSHASEAEKKAATDFIKFFATGDPEYKFWQSSGKIPAAKDGQNVDFITGADYEGYLNQIASGCLPTITFPGIPGLKSALGDAYSAVFSGEMTNEQAVAKLVKDIAEVIADYN